MPSSSPREDWTGRCHLPLGGVSYTYPGNGTQKQIRIAGLGLPNFVFFFVQHADETCKSTPLKNPMRENAYIGPI